MKPLLHEDADEFERKLLGSASEQESPPPGARERAMAAVGLLPTAPGVSRGPASTSAGSPSGALAGLALAAALVVGGTVLGVSWQSFDSSAGAPSGARAPSNASVTNDSRLGAAVPGEPSDHPAEAPSTPVAEAPAAPSITPDVLPNARPERTAAIPSARRAPEPAKVENTPPGRADDDALARETLVIDEARRAAASGDPKRALGLLDVHDRDFSPAAFAVDAEVLRIEALEKVGRTADADRLARAFLVRHIEGSYARRVQAVRDRIAGASAPDLR
ncbi:hypothetical protein AKJ09_01976 [Labilithrix luteola]|uniref:Uncharacterized protein n=1 Tax=Labilithrix luteola TaxID=1391654 RepID=A0A0K1PP78_9BACT|nr:hypothetical protein AKJ09_01976 [Labilithrix luteola]